MTYQQKKVLKARLRCKLRFSKNELKKWKKMGSSLHMRGDKIFKVGFSNIRKEVRLFQRLNSKI